METREIKLIPSKTYKNRQSMERAIGNLLQERRHLVMTNEDGRVYPVFIGAEQNIDLIHSGHCVVS